MSEAIKSKTLGETMENPFAAIFGNEFRDFFSPFEIVGQARVKDDCCDLLSVIAKRQGRGCFKRFLKALKGEFAVIRVLHCNNRRLALYLTRVGFNRVSWHEADGELVPGLIWHADVAARGLAQREGEA